MIARYWYSSNELCSDDQGDVPHLWETRYMTATALLSTDQSKLFFGNSHMFDLVVEIVRIDGEFSAKLLVERTRLPNSIVTSLMKKLRDADFITFVGTAPGERTRPYVINENPWWDAARQYA